MNLSLEKKLALKISIIAFLVLIFILMSIILSSYLYSKNRARIEFINERRVFDGMRLITNEIEEQSRTGILNKIGQGPRRGPRDIIIFDNKKNIIKNDVINLSPESIEKLFSLSRRFGESIEIDEKRFLVSKEELNGYVFFLLHDLTPLKEYHEDLLSIGVIGSLFGFLIIFFMANHLASITIAPIRKHNKDLESYSHNVAHELRTPLAIMRQNLELLGMKPSEKLIQSTNEEIAGMERIIDTLLFLAKPEQNHQIKEELNMTKELSTIIEGYKNPDIDFSHPKKSVTKKTHPELFRRVLNNLIENALKYRSGGNISITLSEQAVIIENAIPTDMDEREIQNLTKAFYQGDSSRNSSGYGLGLALVDKIVEIEGWRMSIQGTGRKFVVKISF